MTLFLEQWIQCRLGVAVDFSNVGAEFFDGSLFYQILRSYNVVGSEVQQYFLRATTTEEALNNLNLLRVTFKLLGVLRNEEVLEEISRKNGVACVDLLNQLYLKLSNKHALPIVTDGKAKQVQRQETGRFKVTRVKEKVCHLPQRKRPEQKLLSRLESSIRVFGKNASDTALLKSPRDSRSKFEDSTRKIKEEIEKKIKGCKCGATIDDCLKKFDERVEQAAGDTYNNICPPDDYVKMLKLRSVKRAADKEIEVKLRDIIVKKIWCKQMQQREQEFHCSLAEKLLKQSNYEREMAQRLGQIHLRHKLMVEKRRQAHEECQRLYKERLENIVWRQESMIDLDKEREKQRLLELHKKIFDERIAQAQQEKLDMVKEVVNDLIDFAIKYSNFESENLVKVSNRDLKLWKAMFIKGLPLLSKEQEVREEERLSETESNESFESLLGKETVEEVLNDFALNEYLILLGPWAKELWPELETVEEEMDILGFAVHRLLEFKYPLPQPPEPVDLPLFPVRAVLNNIYDAKSIKTLKTLLDKPKIDVIEFPALINFCIAQYKKEAGLDVKPNKKKEKLEKAKTKGGKKVKEEEPKFKSVEIQYPSLLDTEPKLSRFAELGKISFQILSSGSTVSDDLIIDILTEYIQNLSEKEGWVLVNFPVDCRQIYNLEFKFTGIAPPIRCNLLPPKATEEQEESNSEKMAESKLTSISGFNESEFYEELSIESETMDAHKLNELRTSKLVPRPNPAPPKIEFKSYFTCFVQIEQASNIEEPKANTKVEPKQESNESIEEESSLKESSLEEHTPKAFYATTDIYFQIPYTKIDLSILKKIGRAILNESDEEGLERKTSLELFGDVVKEKASKKDLTKSKKLPPKLPSISISIVEEENSIEPIQSEIIKDESIPCQIAEPCWVFTALEFPSGSKVALASFWESIELTYIQNWMDLFSFYREHDSTVVPYRNLVLSQLNAIMETLDERQELVDEFLSQLNDVNDLIRANGEVKREMYCRIFELQLKLWEQCDVKKTSCEAKRQEIISNNWFPFHIRELFNIYISMLETEIDRFTDSVQFLQDYYISCFEKPPSTTKLEKLFLPRYKVSEFEIKSNSSTTLKNEGSISKAEVEQSKNNSNKNTQSKRSLDFSFNTSDIIEYFTEILTNIAFDRETEDPYIRNINELVAKVMNEISTVTSQQLSMVEKERKQMLPGKTPKSRAKTAKKKGSIITKDKSEKSNLSQKNATDIDEENLKKEERLKACNEWAKGIQDEMDRTVFRIILIKSRFQNDLNELKDLLTETFHGIHNEISTRYFQQTRDCDNLLKVLMAAVEAETKVESKLFLTLDRFYIEQENEAEPQSPPPPTPIDEIDEDLIFTIQQLRRFAEKMVMVSPLGITVETFIYIIEDMVLMGRENGYPYLPKGWCLMNRREIRKVIKAIFGEVAVVDWKDFLIFGLEFRFPTLQEVIETREQFILFDPLKTETINREDFKKTCLWFERELCETIEGDLRVVLGKQFLFDLYKISDNEMNYTAFLLNYCKDDNPIDGFGKALSLATGRGYVLSEEKNYLLDLEAMKHESEKIAKQIINILLQDTLNRAEGTVITEVDDDGNPIKEFEEFVKSDFGLTQSEKVLKSFEVTRESVKSTKLRSSKSRASIKSKTAQEKPRESSSTKSKDSKSIEQTTPEVKNDENTDEYQGWETNVVWKSWLPRELVLSLILTSLQAYALPEDLLFVQTELEEELNQLVKEKGIRDCIQGYVLAQSPLMKDIFSKCYKFKKCHLSRLIKTNTSVNQLSSINNGF